MRAFLKALLVPALLGGCASASTGRSPAPTRDAETRAQLERRYAENNSAFLRWDLPAVMALRAPGFHAVTPDGLTNDRATMERYTEGLLNGIKKSRGDGLPTFSQPGPSLIRVTESRPTRRRSPEEGCCWGFIRSRPR